jgi:glycosyltransferase involved in cell wall biosynthesis
MAEKRWLYVFDGKLKGVGIDLVAEQELRALSEAGLGCELISRGRLPLPGIVPRAWAWPPTKLLSWLPSQDYYALNKRFFSVLGGHYFNPSHHWGVVAWSKTALKPFEAAARSGIPRILNVGNFHCDFEAGGKPAPARWPRIEKARLRREYDLASRILVASDFAAETFRSCGIPGEKLVVAHRGVDAQKFRPLAERSSRPFIVATCGYLGERKGTSHLLRAWKRLGLTDAELWLIGKVPADEEAGLRALAGENVRFLGFRRDLPEILPRVHVHVLLSRNEGFAKVLLEAAVSGAVNVCTAETGWPEEAPGAILIADRADETEVATALEHLFSDAAQLEKRSQEAREWVLEHLTWSHFRARFRAALAHSFGQTVASQALSAERGPAHAKKIHN